MDVVLDKQILGDEAEAEIKAWKKADGDAVHAGELIAEVETGKAVVEVTAPRAGTLKILVGEGTLVELDTPIARIA
jgi:pyruvate/2-oxoglutarate dehydrogenase complex dihydrolipoamide acyltransferase (E2) component